MIKILFFVLLGCLSGLLPGLHPNLLSDTFSTGLRDDILLLSLMLGISIPLSYIPSIFMGVPQDSTLSLLPGQRLYLLGEGKSGLKYILRVILITILISILLLPLTFYTYPILFDILTPVIRIILVLILIYMFLLEFMMNGLKRLYLSVLIALLSGLLGLLFLDSIPNSLTVLFSGLFAMSSLSLTFSLEQPSREIYRKIPVNYSTIILGVIGGYVADLLPVISSPAQMTLLLAPLLYKKDQNSVYDYLGFLVSVNVSHVIFAYPSVLLGHPRIGVLTHLTFVDVLDVIGGLSFLIMGMLIGYLLTKKMITLPINYSRVRPLLLVYLPVFIFVLSGWKGLVVFLLATILGVITVHLRVRRVYLMNVLLIPFILS